jgi:ribulose-phosphate 3-epimerase
MLKIPPGGLQVAPSLLAADWARIGEEVSTVEHAGADLLHLDVMDGDFVPPISFGQDFVAAVRKRTSLPLDVHLMISSPERHIESFVDAGADIITFHIEATKHPHRLLQQIQGHGVRAGIALNPGTAPMVLDACIEDADLVLVMTVNPGWGGQKFISSMLDKVEYVAKHPKRKPETHIEVDGGISSDTAAACVTRGANILVAGTSVFGTPDYKSAVSVLKNHPS